ncbi:hypothetical protein [Streptomyces venezuelae]|uniref:hypothetical protein n=1 Tax=Streptomyces venezuelae TaxID=54571 RepID=UPI0037AF3062
MESLRRTRLLKARTPRVGRTTAVRHARRFPYGQRFHRWHTLRQWPPHRPGR